MAIINLDSIRSLEELSKGDILITSYGSEQLITFVNSGIFKKLRRYDVRAIHYSDVIITDYHYKMNDRKQLYHKINFAKGFPKGCRGYDTRKVKLKKAGLI